MSIKWSCQRGYLFGDIAGALAGNAKMSRVRCPVPTASPVTVLWYYETVRDCCDLAGTRPFNV